MARANPECGRGCSSSGHLGQDKAQPAPLFALSQTGRCRPACMHQVECHGKAPRQARVVDRCRHWVPGILCVAMDRPHARCSAASIGMLSADKA